MKSQFPYPAVLEGLHEADAALAFAEVFKDTGGTYVWLCLNNREAERIADNLQFFLPPATGDGVLLIPGSEADPYRGLSTHPEIAEKRAVALWKLLQGHEGFVVTTLASIATRMISPKAFLNECIQLEVGSFIPMDHLLGKLRELGYVREDPVTEYGEYSWRGGIVDIYSPAGAQPVRVEFFGDEIESIRSFDPATQRSTALVPECYVVPMREIVVTRREIDAWHNQAPEYWNEVRFAESLSEKLQFTGNAETFNGFEYLFPLVIDNSHSLLEYARQGDNSALPRIVISGQEEFVAEFERFHARLRSGFEDRDLAGELALPPERLLFGKQDLMDWAQEYPVSQVEPFWSEPGETQRFDFQLERKYQGRIQEILSDLSAWRGKGERVVFVMPSRGMAERVIDIFAEYDTPVYFAEGGFAETQDHPLSVTQGKVTEGFYSPRLKLHILPEHHVFEESQLRTAVRRPAQREMVGTFLSDFRDLKAGDYVVHVDHGIGMFRGLKRIGVGEDVREFVELVYRDEAKLYVPTDHLDLIQKYSGAGGAKPVVDRLGGVSWERTKTRIKKSMRSMAEDLVKLYARRQLVEGFSFSPDDGLMREFEEAFEFEETPDQAAAIRDVKIDMEAPRPMDRLVCGDVGYGKTEVAMRAAFKCLNDGKQVAVLAPTTVLTFQHFNTFRERFRGFPVTVDMVSRFRSRAEQTDVLQRTTLGMVDILIGTHRLLSKDVKFRDLGLLIIDEEQRFGVAQKEKIKQLKTRVDVLTLSATPIPRTLNLSLLGLRDLSIIETPPKDRLSIQTVVVKFRRNIIRSAIDLELKRRGQVFFLHNSIETIYSIAQMVQETIPEARVAVAHGQMRESQLEEVMLDFLNYKYDVLVTTTIIENGLDIPRANTLIVNRADRFGLAQLYQLRGRVGRSNRRAYAYLLIPSEETLTGDARKRLAAIREFSDLGAGFRIAAMDLEIRGTGNLLGAEQHGHISAIGLELYMKLLDETIRELKGEKAAEEVETSIDLHMDIQIPEHFIADSNQRLWLYKRLSSVSDEEGLKTLKDDVMDRFGKYPRAVSNLFEYALLRLRARPLKILSVERRGGRALLKFREDTPVSAQHLIDLLRGGSGLALSPEGILSVELPSSVPTEVFERLHRVLTEISVLE